MQSADITELIEFSDDEVVRGTLFETAHLWSQVICLNRNQTFGPASDPLADAQLVVFAGEAAFQVDRKRKRLGQWSSIVVPAGSELTVTNASADPLVILMVTAPPPAADGD